MKPAADGEAAVPLESPPSEAWIFAAIAALAAWIACRLLDRRLLLRLRGDERV